MPRMKPIEKWIVPYKQIDRLVKSGKMTDAEGRAAGRVQWALFVLASNRVTSSLDVDELLAAVIEAQKIWPEKRFLMNDADVLVRAGVW